MRWAQWLAAGKRVRVSAGPGRPKHRMFRRVVGSRPEVTFLHGFPTSSWDWAAVDRLLPEETARMFLDHLGFGASDKPWPYRYTIGEQLDLVVAHWRDVGVERSALVVHDYSVSIALELLARIREGTWDGPELSGVMFLNGGLFYSRQRPLVIQRMLRTPVLGPMTARLVTERTFQRNMRRIVHEDHPWHENELAQHWDGITAYDGRRVVPGLSRYHGERRRHEARWEEALAEATVPLRAAWGMADPISGVPMAEHLGDAHPHVCLVTWDDVGHYPQCEVPKRVATEVLRVVTA